MLTVLEARVGCTDGGGVVPAFINRNLLLALLG